MNDSLAIAPLTKVKLDLCVLSEAHEDDTATPRLEFSFVFGIGTQGLTAFERDLVGKHCGDSTTLHVGGARLLGYFEHLLSPLLKAVETDPPFDLHFIVQDVSHVSARELVHALAKIGGDGGCGCDCGCGGNGCG